MTGFAHDSAEPVFFCLNYEITVKSIECYHLRDNIKKKEQKPEA